jgi:hypothetical protein
MNSVRSVGESIKEGARRLSNSFMHKLSIVSMDKRERRDYHRKRHNASEENRSSIDSAPQSPSVLSLDNTRFSSSSQTSGLASPGKPLPGSLSKGERVALDISKVIDPLKALARPGTADSEMSFGMTDVAPPGTMNACEGCFQPTWDYLKHGLCQDCLEIEAKVAKDKKGKSKGK